MSKSSFPAKKTIRMDRPPMNVLRPMVRRDIRPQTTFLLEMKFETPERLMLLGVRCHKFWNQDYEPTRPRCSRAQDYKPANGNGVNTVKHPVSHGGISTFVPRCDFRGQKKALCHRRSGRKSQSPGAPFSIRVTTESTKLRPTPRAFPGL